MTALFEQFGIENSTSISPHILGPEQGHIGTINEFFRIGGVIWENSAADTDRDSSFETVGSITEIGLGDGVT